MIDDAEQERRDGEALAHAVALVRACAQTDDDDALALMPSDMDEARDMITGFIGAVTILSTILAKQIRETHGVARTADDVLDALTWNAVKWQIGR